MRHSHKSLLHSLLFFITIFGITHSETTSVQLPKESARKKIPMSITTSGGVSLGAYQAGYHYYMMEWLKERTDIFEVKVVSGASAGAINALITVLALSSEREEDPTKSIFYRGWVPIDYKDLKGSTSAFALLNRVGIDKQASSVIDAALAKGKENSNEMDLVLGITATRVKPFIENFDSLRIPKVEEKFAVKVNKKPGENIRFRNYLYEDYNLYWPVLPFGTDSAKDILKDLIYASSAFPIAFEPQKIKHKMINSYEIIKNDPSFSDTLQSYNLWKALESLRDSVNVINYTDADFIDGGVFDNQPIGFAYELSKHGLTEQKDTTKKDSWAWLPNLTKDENLYIGDSMKFVYINPRNALYPVFKKDKLIGQSDYISYLRKGLGNIAGAITKRELYRFMKDRHRFSEWDNLYQTENYIPIASGYLFNFFGFFEKSVRRFDFFLGMYEAERFGQKIDSLIKEPFKHVEIKTAVQEIRTHKKRDTTLTWDNEYNCLKSVFDTLFDRIDALQDNSVLDVSELGGEACDNCDNAEFKKVLQTAVDLLWFRWKIAVEFPGIIENQDMLRPEFKQLKMAIEKSKSWPSVTSVTIADMSRKDRPNPSATCKNRKIRDRKIKKMRESIVEEDGLSTMLYLLCKYDFEFTNLGPRKRKRYLGSRNRYNKVYTKLVSQFQYLADNLAGNQYRSHDQKPADSVESKQDKLADSTWNSSKRTGLKIVSKRGLNFLYYYPNRWNLYLSYGHNGAVFGAGFGIIPGGRIIRLNIPITTMHTLDDNWKIDDNWEIQVIPGLDFELPFISNAVFQLRIGAGYVLSMNIKKDTRDTNGLIYGFSPKISATLLELIYLSFRHNWVKYKNTNKKYDYNRIQVGLQFSPRISPRKKTKTEK